MHRQKHHSYAIHESEVGRSGLLAVSRGRNLVKFALAELRVQGRGLGEPALPWKQEGCLCLEQRHMWALRSWDRRARRNRDSSGIGVEPA